MLNILEESLIRVRTSAGERRASLPETLALLMRDEVEAFPALRPHQRHAWHAFLVQLGAMALQRASVSEPPTDAAKWQALIRGLTPNFPADEPWRLVVDDITKPAFMQPPASAAERERDYADKVLTPDELDMLVTSKNHDLKMAVASDGGADDWLFALISLQTMEGFGGAGNYGISRMNGGLGSRPVFSLAPSERLGAHAKRDITFLLEDATADSRDALLLWLLPWDGAKAEALSLDLDKINPLYIEICRRVRLRQNANGALCAIRATSKAARIEAKALKGRTGDPWTPINLKEGKALTMAGGGFTYKRVVNYLTSGDWQQPALLAATRAERRSTEPMLLVARGMVRGMGKTEGYYERIIPIRSKLRAAAMGRRSGSSDGMDDVGQIADERIKQAAIVQRILSHAIQVFAAGGDSDKVSSEHRKLARPWLNRLDELIDASFFDDLQTEFEADEGAERSRIRKEWLMNGADGVIDNARNMLRDASDSVPCSTIRRYKARVSAEGLFEVRIRGDKGLPSLFDTKNDKNEETQSRLL